MKPAELVLDLPFPPSTNSIWRRVGDRTLLSKGAREYRRAVDAVVAQMPGARMALAGSIAVGIRAYPPDRRKRDLDNLAKCLLDSLQYSMVIVDDGDIDILTIERCAPHAGGRLQVSIVCKPKEPTC